MDQPQQFNRDLRPLGQPPKMAPHHLTPSVAPVLPEEKGGSGPWGGKLPHSPCQALPTPCPNAPNPTTPRCVPIPDTSFTSLGLIPVCLCAESPLGAQGTLAAQSGSVPCSLPTGRCDLSDPLDGERPATPGWAGAYDPCSVVLPWAIPFFLPREATCVKERSPRGRGADGSDLAHKERVGSPGQGGRVFHTPLA